MLLNETMRRLNSKGTPHVLQSGPNGQCREGGEQRTIQYNAGCATYMNLFLQMHTDLEVSREPPCFAGGRRERGLAMFRHLPARQKCKIRQSMKAVWFGGCFEY